MSLATNQQVVDFSQVEDGFTTRVSPTILDDLAIDGIVGNRRKSQRKNDAEFEQSIKERGIIQPVVARPNPNNPERLELLAGYGRREKSLKLELDTIPVLIRVVDDKEALLIHADENDKRSDMSLVDEINICKELNTQYKGDRKAISSRLGWTSKKVNERLELGNCAESVIEALDNGDIKPQHALVLAYFPQNIQDNTIKKCIDGGWTVATLKQRAGAFQMKLSEAKFDTADCDGCAHNSGEQNGLFDMENAQNQCSNFSCYREKTINELTPKIEERFGKVILLSNTSVEVINDLSADAVGEAQFNDGCKACDNNVAILHDTVESFNQVKILQCVDQQCFTNCQSAKQKAEQDAIAAQAESAAIVSDDEAVDADAQSQSTDNDTDEAPAKPAETKKPAKVSTATPRLVTEHNKRLMRQVASDHLINDEQLQKAITLTSLINSTGYNIDGELFSTTGFDKNILTLMTKPVEFLDEHIVKASQFAMTDSKKDGYYNFTDIMINVLKAQDDADSVAVTGWTPTKENLKIYTKQALTQFAEKNEIDKAINAKAANDKAFIQLTNKGKDDLIDGILGADIDWATVAPLDYKTLVA